jgi:tetratricopeptide (TPR) repeat protein
MKSTHKLHACLAFTGLLLVLPGTMINPLAAQLLGEISFPNSGSPEAQKDFIEGVLYLHNFEYEDAADAFLRAQEVDPDFALAYWGEAMTHNHPLWGQQDTEAARSILGRLAPTADERRAKAGSEREALYLEAVETLYGTISTTIDLGKEDRDDRYRQAMQRLHEAYPDDDEATALYALSILGSAHEGRDFATYMRAAAVADTVWDHNEKHPGAAHYLANVIASRVQNVGFAERGRPPRFCGHYPYWLEYGYLQQGRFGEARGILDACRASLTENSEENERWHHAVMRARYLIDTEAWEEAAVLKLETDSGDEEVESIFVDGLAAHFLGEPEVARTARDRLAAISSGDESEKAAIFAKQLAGLGLLESNREEGLVSLTAATYAEAEMPYMFGPPVIVKPSLELLGEVLLSLGRGEDAVDAFRGQLERTPGRAASLLGLQRATEAADGG